MGVRDHSGPWLAAVATAAIWLIALSLGGASSSWDKSLFLALRPQERDGVVAAAWAITWLGDWVVLVPLSMAAAAFLLTRGSRLDAIALLGTVAAVRILTIFQKSWFDRARPNVEQWMTEDTYSFPSAHAANSFATYVAIAILLTGSRTAIGLAIACSTAIGATRIVLGVHWPSDVIGGWAFAAFALIPLWQLRASRRPPRIAD